MPFAFVIAAASFGCVSIALAQTAATAPSSAAMQAAAYRTSQGVAATVNDAIISDYDVTQRVGLFVVTSGINPTSDALERVRTQVVRAMVDEALEAQEAKKYKVTIDTGEVDRALADLAKQNDTTVDAMARQLKAENVDISTLRKQVETQLQWTKLVQGRFVTRINVAEDDVSAVMKRLEQDSNKPQYELSEIFLGVDVPEQDGDIKAGAEQIMQQIELGAPFNVAARQLSQSPSAAQGGDIGWVTDGQLAPELNAPLSTLRVGQMAGPIRSAGGYYVLLLRDRRDPIGTKIPEGQAAASAPSPDGSLQLSRLLLPMPPDAPKDLRDRVLQAGLAMRTRIKSCEDAEKLSHQVQGSVYMSLGAMKPVDMSADLRGALAKTEPGDVAQPFYSSAGVEIIVRCDQPVRKVVPFQMPTRDEVENQLYSDQIAIMARSYLRDLRRDAVVEIR
jgi:peptidyl-prolyl cis-trans isomerase SurA